MRPIRQALTDDGTEYSEQAGASLKFNRDLWKVRFTVLPSWPCPTCSAGYLTPLPETMTTRETDGSKEAHGYDEWEPHWIKARFSVHLKCSNASCGEGAVLIGETNSDLEQSYDYEGRTQSEIVEWFLPVSMFPFPAVIQIPEDAPDPILAEIAAASALVWLDPASSAQKLRLAVELMLTELGVQKHENQDGSGGFLDLARRLKMLPVGKAHVSGLLQPIRWLGNVGAHAGGDGVDRDDLLSAFEILETALDEVFDARKQRVRETARELESRRGVKKSL